MFESITKAIEALNAVTEHSRDIYAEGSLVRAALISNLSFAILAIRGPEITERPTVEIMAICSKAIAAEAARIDAL